jgi:hypothetical protein
VQTCPLRDGQILFGPWSPVCAPSSALEQRRRVESPGAPVVQGRLRAARQGFETDDDGRTARQERGQH